MKKNLLTYLLFQVFIFNAQMKSDAQSINVVSNPNAPGSFTWSSGGALSGYSGTPIILNGTLVLEYNATTTAATNQIKQQLAVYSGGNSITLIANPDAGQGVYFQSIQLIFNSKLFFIYLDVSGIQRLASFDGTSITLYPNPDAGLGYIGSPRILNNTLYVAYSNVAGVTQFGFFNGTGITLIPNPDASTVGFFNNYSVVFNNKICSRYVTANGTKHLANYDFNTNSWTVLPNPDVTTRGIFPSFPALYHNKLYWIYFSTDNQYQFAEYDGTNNPTLIANPENDSPNQGGVSGFPIVLNDTLFFQYADINNVGRLAKFGGTSISLVPNPDATTYGFYNTPIIYNSNLYIFYVTPDGLHHIAQYQGTSNSIKVYANPDAGSGYWDQPIVYDNNLYFVYYNALGYSQLGYFNGSTINLIPNPTGLYNSPNGNNGYVGYPIIFNSLLYMQTASVPYTNAGNLAYFDGSTVPITLINFAAQKNGYSSLLKWDVANESNNAYFSVERSSDGANFQTIGQVAGRGTVSTEHNYNFDDNNPVKGLNFYRLKQVDYDGHFKYSNVVTIDFSKTGAVFSIYPNPAVKNLTVNLPASSSISILNVYDLNGIKMMTTQISANTVSQTLDVSKLSAGVYQINLLQYGKQQTLKFVKE